MRKFFTNRLNTFLDATYFVPRKLGKLPLRLKPPRAAPRAGLLHRRDQRADRRARPGARPSGPHGPPHLVPHAHEGRPRRHLRPLPRQVSHEPELDRPKRRDELARMTNGYSPAMIEQVCSMALTYAHSDGRADFDRADIVEAMTTIESGTAVGVDVRRRGDARGRDPRGRPRRREPRLHAQHDLDAPVDPQARRARCGHHQAIANEERFSKFRHEDGRRPRLVPRGDGRRARVLRREHQRRRRRPPQRHVARSPRWWARRAWAPSRSTSAAACRRSCSRRPSRS